MNNQRVTALTTNQMKQNNSFVDWDFTNTWGIQTNNTYPVLLSVRNNAPFAFNDTLAVGYKHPVNTNIIVNDYDYETINAHFKNCISFTFCSGNKDIRINI